MVQEVKSAKGTVSIESFQGRLRLRLPRALYEGKQKYITLGLADTPENRAIAEQNRALAERDIKFDLFDFTYSKYKPGSHAPLEIVKDKPPLKLDELWEQFIEYKRPQCSPSTMRNQYKVLSGYVKRLPTYDLDKANQIRDWAINNLPIESCKRFIVRLNACCSWAVRSGLIASSPFKGMASEIKLPKSQRTDGMSEINPFTAEERDLILQAFQADRFCSKYSRVKHSFYFPYVFFLFNSGCRPSEAVALKWKHINESCQVITFEESVVRSEEGKTRKRGLKTQASRKFTCNARMQDFLKSIRPENWKPDQLVFPSPTGTEIDPHNFCNRIWQTVLEGSEIEYRKPYQTRHTFITLALQHGMSVQDVARAVGNSPGVIFKHYAGNSRELVVPEF
ncbi:MAG: tyrosine-type recombinase/integrase [Elainellaceae cyanobacterium]